MASRMRLISAELVEISTSVKSCITRLRGVAVVTESVCHVEMNSMIGPTGVSSQVKEVKDTGENCPPGIAVADDLDVTEVVVDPTEVLNFGAEIYGTVPKPPIPATTKVVEASTISGYFAKFPLRISQQMKQQAYFRNQSARSCKDGQKVKAIMQRQFHQEKGNARLLRMRLTTFSAFNLQLYSVMRV